jgi:general secretion pathway protein D
MRIAQVFRLIAVLLAAGIVASCAGGYLNESGSNLLDDKLDSKPSRSGSKQKRLDQFFANSGNGQRVKGVNRIGNDSQTGTGEQQSLFSDNPGEKNIRLNLVDAPVASAAKSVLGDILELNYSIDPRVQGTVTVQTAKLMNKDEVIGLFENALASIGAAIVNEGESFRILPQAEVANTALTLETGDGAADLPGQGQYVVPIRYVSAEDIREVIDPLIPEGMLVKVSNGRNALLLTGTARQVATIKETISVFDPLSMTSMKYSTPRRGRCAAWSALCRTSASGLYWSFPRGGNISAKHKIGFGSWTFWLKPVKSNCLSIMCRTAQRPNLPRSFNQSCVPKAR